jgi:lipoprotein-anchoring transpeptidase ErfK/SrfK
MIRDGCIVKKKLMIFLVVFSLFFPLSAVQAAPVVENVCGDAYTVRPGDSLRKIAGKCETTLANLLVWNPNITNSNRIYVGQRINLAEPDLTQPVVMLEPSSGDTGSLTQIQIRNFPSKAEIIIAIGEQVEDLFELESIKTDINGSFDMDMLVTGEPGRDWFVQVRLADDPEMLVTSEMFRIVEEELAEGPITYVVQPGDSLSKIAKRFNRTTSHILVANPEVTNPNRIYPGQELLIPGESEQVYRLIEERAPAVAEAVANGERWIEVDLAHQSVHAWEGGELVRSFLVSTGKPSTPTVTGQFNIWVKLRYDDMRGPGYHLRNVPYVMYFYKGYGLHGTYWHNDFGNPRSAGCVNLRTEDAAWLYNFAEVGTLVDVH